MRTRACLFCGKGVLLRRQAVWRYNPEAGRVLKTYTGPFPDREEREKILALHEVDCRNRMFVRHYGARYPLEIWGVSRT